MHLMILKHLNISVMNTAMKVSEIIPVTGLSVSSQSPLHHSQPRTAYLLLGCWWLGAEEVEVHITVLLT